MIAERRLLDPGVSYVASQLNGPLEDFYRKLPEEATEVMLSCLVSGETGRIRAEAADVLFQLLLVLAKHDIPLADVVAELQVRHHAAAEVH